jgi:RHS repeat-associated protein
MQMNNGNSTPRLQCTPGITRPALRASDGDNRVTQTVDGDSHITSTAYDGNGRVTLTTDGNTHTHQSQYDKAGRMTATVDGSNHTTQMQFDPAGNKTAVIDPNTHTSQYGFDELNRLTQVTDPDSNTTTCSLDAAGRATKVVSPAPTPFTTTHSFDGNGQITRLTTQDGGIVNYSYDGAGRKLTDGNGTFTYDGRGHILTATSPLGTGTASYAFSYDPAGRLTNVTEPFTLTLSYAYDNAGNQTQVIDSLGGTTSSTYDSDNFLTQRTYQGQTQTFRFDFVNNKEGWNTTLSRYNDLGGNTLVAKSVYGYDSVGQVTSLLSTDRNGATINKFVFSLDSADRVTSETDTQYGATTTTSYTYDSAGQLLPSGTQTYTYDPNGNRTGGNSGYVVTTGNQMTADLSWTYSYDGEGNLEEKDKIGSHEKWKYTYNPSNELTEVKHYDNNGSLTLTVDYTYSAFGEQIEEDVNGTPFTEFALDGWNSNMASPTGNENINVWARLDQNNHLITRYVWGDRVDQQLARIDFTPATPYWTLQDRLGSIRDVINNSGGVDDIQYDAFGNITAETQGGSAYRGWYAYSGREYDTEINLQYNHARWYDSFSGRWISQDPLGFDARDSNLYRYVNNGPTIATDPTGLDFIAVGNRAVSGSLDKGGHYSLAYFQSTDKNVVARIDNLNRERKGRTHVVTDAGCLEYPELKYPEFIDGPPARVFNNVGKVAITKKLAGMELLGDFGWRAPTLYYGTGILNFASGRYWKQTDVWISLIKYEEKAEFYYPVFDGTDAEVKATWEKMVAFAASYKYAEQTDKKNGEFSGTFKNWPLSVYAILGTNSRTFVVQTLKHVGLTLSRTNDAYWNPGDNEPNPITSGDGTSFGAWRYSNVPGKEPTRR